MQEFMQKVVEVLRLELMGQLALGTILGGAIGWSGSSAASLRASGRTS